MIWRGWRIWRASEPLPCVSPPFSASAGSGGNHPEPAQLGRFRRFSAKWAGRSLPPPQCTIPEIDQAKVITPLLRSVPLAET